MRLPAPKVSWKNSGILLICASTFILALVCINYLNQTDQRKFLSADSSFYLAIANNLLKSGEFSRSPSAPYLPELSVVPVYPAFLALIFKIGGENFFLIALVQSLLFSITVFLVFRIALKLGIASFQAVLITSLFAFNPIVLLLSNLILTETIFLLELVASLFFFIEYYYNHDWYSLIGSAILLSLAVLTRPVAQFLIIIWVVVILLSQSFWKNKLLKASVFVSVYLVLITPWIIRNLSVAGVGTLSTISNTNLVDYRAKAVLMDAEGLSAGQAMAKLNTIDSNSTLNEVLKIKRSRALQVFLEYPWQTVETTIKGTFRLLVDPGFALICTILDPRNSSSECFPGEATMLEGGLIPKVVERFRTMLPLQQLALIWSTLLMGLLYLGAAFGSWKLLRQHRWSELLLLLGSIVYFVALSSGPESDYRLRVPILPFLALLSGLALSQKWDTVVRNGKSGVLQKNITQENYE